MTPTGTESKPIKRAKINKNTKQGKRKIEV
jgi:hypothetical protein